MAWFRKNDQPRPPKNRKRQAIIGSVLLALVIATGLYL